MSEEAEYLNLANELVRNAQTGDRRAFERLIKLHFRRIHRWALIGTGDPDDADDVTQRVLILVHRKLRSFRGDAGFESWLYRITSNAVGELFRKRKSRRRAMHRYEASGVKSEMTEATEKGPADRIAADQAELSCEVTGDLAEHLEVCGACRALAERVLETAVNLHVGQTVVLGTGRNTRLVNNEIMDDGALILIVTAEIF